MLTRSWLSALMAREKAGQSVNIAIFGGGWFGGGLVRELQHWPGMVPRLIISRNQNKAIKAFFDAGISRSDIRHIRTPADLKNGLAQQKFLIATDVTILDDLTGIDVFFDATGHILAGASAALKVMPQGIHFITVSSELDATIGYALQHMAQRHNVIYSNCDGDQPGVLVRMVDEVRAMGFEVAVAGNCKGFLDCYKTPDDVLPWVRPGHSPRMVTAFTDGTKQGLELAVLANCTRLVPDKRGMHGPRVTKDTIISEFIQLISRNGIVDYVMGIDGVNQGGGVFVIGKRTEEKVVEDMQYLKMGVGPYYLFFRDYHLCYLEAPMTIAEVVVLKRPTLKPSRVTSEVLSVAKRDLKAGEPLDGIGGYTVFGLLDREDVVRQEKLVPIGIADFAVMTTAAERDTALTYDMLDFPCTNDVLRLRREQDAVVAKEAAGTSSEHNTNEFVKADQSMEANPGHNTRRG